MDFDKIFDDMLNAMKISIGKDWSQAQKYVKKIMQNNKADIKEITDYFINGELTEVEYKEEMKDNLKTLENEMLNLKIMSKKAIQDAINAGIDVVMKAVTII